eukprot:gene14121-21637_t
MKVGSIDALVAMVVLSGLYKKFGQNVLNAVAAACGLALARAGWSYWARKRLQRSSAGRQLTAVIVGAGPSGIAAAIKCTQLGIDYVVLETADKAGGTWVNNTYPQCACDVPAYLYHYSFEEKNDWSCPYPLYPEVAAYFQMVSEKHGVHAKTKYRHKALRASWLASEQTWVVDVQNLETSAESKFTANFLVAACGQLHEPAEPSFDVSAFKGPMFHTARWDESHSLKNKKVAVIGTGASAMQLVPCVQKEVKELVVYQRSPNWINTSPMQASPFWDFLVRHSYVVYLYMRYHCFYGADVVLFNSVFNRKTPAAVRQNFENNLRTKMAAQLDPARKKEMEEKLLPQYPVGCKRLCMSDGFIPALMQPNVRIVTDPVLRLSERGVVVNVTPGRTGDAPEEAFDAIILATGFKTGSYSSPFDITGAQGKTLQQMWADDGYGPQAYLGVAVPHFPNLFMYYGPGTNLGAGSILIMIEGQMELMGLAMETVIRKQGSHCIELSEAAYAQRIATYKERVSKTVWADDYCVGKDGKKVNAWNYWNTNWYGTVREYREL